MNRQKSLMPAFDEAAGLTARPDPCARKHGGNAESTAAFSAVAPHIRAVHAEIIRLDEEAGSRGVTLKDIAKALRKPPNAVSGRLSELRSHKYCREALGRSNAILAHSGRRRDGCAVLVIGGES